jgi:hypothetical protein
MTQNARAFDPMRYARVRAYNDETGRKMTATPVPSDGEGVRTCAPLGEGKWQIGFEWDQPRDILGVRVLFAGGSPLPADWHVEYWHYSWPNEQKDRRVGAHKGWLLTDDAYHGRWLAAYGEQTTNAENCAVVFDPIDVNEVLCVGGDYPQHLFLSDDYNAMFRRALKFRVVFEGAQAPRVREIELTGNETVREERCVLYPNATGRATDAKAEVLSVWNGELLSGQGPAVENAMREIPEMQKNMQPKYGRYVLMGWDGARQKFALRYNGDIFANKIDQKVSGRDTAKTHWAAAELHFRLASGDPPARHEGNDDAAQSMPDPRVPVYVTEWLDRDVSYRQTSFATLMGPTPEKMRGDEDVMVMGRVEIRNASSDPRTARLMAEVYPAERLLLEGDALVACGRVRPGDTPDTEWTVQPYPAQYLRAQVRSNGRGRFNCIPFTAAGTTSLSMQPQFGFEGYDRNPVRKPPSSCVPTTLLYEIELGAYETHTIDFVLPYPSLSEAADWEKLRARDFDTELARVRAHWLAYAKRGAQIALPGERKLNDFAQAVPWHVALTAMRDPRTGLCMVPAGTYGYGSCGNEASLQIHMLDELGYHDLAETYLETFVQSQGTGSMDGNFASNDGALVANNYGGYSDNVTSSFAYNLDHGYILECLVDHYRLTGDRKWLERVAGTLVKACDYIFTERKATMRLDEQGEELSCYGLMPHGHLEDNPEWRCWFAVNAHACGGILGTSEILKEIGCPDADRIGIEAEKYRDDIHDCVLRATAGSPAVPTGNGGYMPHVPTHAEIRGRDWGWFREVAYGPLHLVKGRVLSPEEKLTTWILRDQEDNLFLSCDYGRAVDRERYWFSRGGMTIQSNLLFNDEVYLERGESERAVRMLFNDFAQNLYRDVNCFTEHPITDFGLGFGPFFKTPDEAQFIVNLRNHLLLEEGDELCLLGGAPRAWLSAGKTLTFKDMATFFGPASLDLRVSEDGRTIDLSIDAKWRKAPRAIRLCLRTPGKEAPASITLNGDELPPTSLANEALTLENPPETIRLSLRY